MTQMTQIAQIAQTNPKLELATPFPDIPDLWVDPITGLSVPKRVTANIQWRVELLQRAADEIPFDTRLAPIRRDNRRGHQ